MPLSDFSHRRKTIQFDGGEFEVRAISLPDVAGLITRHQDSIDRIAAILQAQSELNFSDTRAMADVLLSIIRDCPYVVADLIASCADEPEAFHAAFDLPITLQVDTLQAIADLTFADEVALKKFIAAVKSLLRGILPTATATTV